MASETKPEFERHPILEKETFEKLHRNEIIETRLDDGTDITDDLLIALSKEVQKVSESNFGLRDLGELQRAVQQTEEMSREIRKKGQVRITVGRSYFVTLHAAVARNTFGSQNGSQKVQGLAALLTFRVQI